MADKIKAVPVVSSRDVKSQVTKTSGNGTITAATFSRNGKLGALSISVSPTADVAAGNNVFVGNVPSECASALAGSTAGYSGNSVLVFNLAGDVLTIRVTGATFPSGWNCGATINYLLLY